MRGAPGGRHVYADSHADTQAVVDVTVTIAVPFLQFFRLRLPDRPGVVSGVLQHRPDQHPEQDAGVAVAVGLGFRLRFGFEFAGRVGADVEFADGLVEFADGLTVPDGLILSVPSSQTSASATVSASLDAFIASSPQQREQPARVRPARRPSPNCA